MKDLSVHISEALLVEALKFDVVADVETKDTDYIKVDAIDKNYDLIDEVGFVAIKDLGNKLGDEKTWLPDLGKYIGKNHHLSNTDLVSVQYFDENEGEWIQFAGVRPNGKIELWDPDALEVENPFK